MSFVSLLCGVVLGILGEGIDVEDIFNNGFLNMGFWFLELVSLLKLLILSLLSLFWVYILG